MRSVVARPEGRERGVALLAATDCRSPMCSLRRQCTLCLMFRAVRSLTFGVPLLALLACDPDTDTDPMPPHDGGSPEFDGGAQAPAPCTVEAVTSCPDPAPRFADVEPIFKKRCSTCHVDNWSGPWPLDTYQHIADWADVIRDLVRTCTMPPPEAGMPLPNEEAETILTWIRCNTPK